VIGSVGIDFGSAPADVGSSVDQRALEIVGRRGRMVREEKRRDSGDERGAHRRAAAPEVDVADAALRVVDVDGRARCPQ
jgi:hypothetical protein